MSFLFFQQKKNRLTERRALTSTHPAAVLVLRGRNLSEPARDQSWPPDQPSFLRYLLKQAACNADLNIVRFDK